MYIVVVVLMYYIHIVDIFEGEIIIFPKKDTKITKYYTYVWEQYLNVCRYINMNV